MSSLAASNVYQGFWTDYSYGSVLGATLTINSTAATILVAFTAALLSITGARAWRIFALFYFLARASDELHDGFHQQQQAVIRNTSSPDAFVLTTLKMFWHLKKHTKRCFLRTSGSFLIAAICSLAFIAAGVFSARIISNGNINILVRSPYCGIFNFTGPNARTAAGAYIFDLASESLQFARSCYNSSAENPSCQIYATKVLPLKSYNRTECPFPAGCLGASMKPAIQLDSGLLDSNDMFGINAPVQDRVQFRSLSTCAIIDAARLQQISHNQTILDIGYGSALPGEETYVYSLGVNVYNESQPPNATYLRSSYALARKETYELGAMQYYPSNITAGVLIPYPDFRFPSGDQFFIAVTFNSVLYDVPCNDPLFAAHKVKRTLSFDDASSFSAYESDHPIGLVGCSLQYQVCNTMNPRRCTTLDNFESTFQQAHDLGLSIMQNATMQLFNYFIQTLQVDFSLLSQAVPTALVAAESVSNNDASAGATVLPGNQWEIEVQGWVNLLFAGYQRGFAGYALGPGWANSDWEDFTTKPSTAAEERLCKSQKMKAPGGFSNINVFGLSIVVVVCGLLTLTDIFLPDILRRVAKRRPKLSSKMNSWDQSGTLQMQRIAYQALGLGNWENACKAIPYADREDRLTSLTSPYIDNSTATATEKLNESEDDSTSHGSQNVEESGADGDASYENRKETSLSDRSVGAVDSTDDTANSIQRMPANTETGSKYQSDTINGL